MSDVTPGWAHVHIGTEGDGVTLGGVDVWAADWRNLNQPVVIVAHPIYPRQRHKMIVYEFDTPEGPVKFAAGEVSNGIWCFFVPDADAGSSGTGTDVSR